MEIGFWDSDCFEFTQKLWKPPLRQNTYTPPEWGYNDSLLTFQRSRRADNVTTLDFLPIPETDNEKKKYALFNKKFGSELGRFSKYVAEKLTETEKDKKEIVNKNLIALINKYIDTLVKELARIRKRKNSTTGLDTYNYSNYSFKNFCCKCLKIKNISDKEQKIIDGHINAVKKIHVKMVELDKIVRCKTVKILPTPEQTSILERWFRLSVEIYNDLAAQFQSTYDEISRECDRLYDDDPEKGRRLGEMLRDNNIFPIAGRKLRDLLRSYFSGYDMPGNAKDDLIMSFASSVKGNVTKLLSHQITEFTMKPRDFKKNYPLSVQTQNTSKNGFFTTFLGNMKIDNSIRKITLDDKKNPVKEGSFDWSMIKKDFKLMYDTRYKGYVIFCPMERELKNVITKRDPIAVMDPGMVKFQELYGIDHTITIGEDLKVPILKRIKRIEYMEKRLDDDEFNKRERAKFLERHIIKEEKEKRGDVDAMKKCEKKRFLKRQDKRERDCDEEREHMKITYDRELPLRNNLKKVIKRERKKISNLVAELHNKTCLYLCKNYDRIMVTNFSCKKVNGKMGKLSKNTKKVLSALSHYKFRQRLQNKCVEYRCQYLEVTEEWTSKTCCMCGEINMTLEGERTLDCKNCTAIDRDVNGAINILIKNRREVIYD